MVLSQKNEAWGCSLSPAPLLTAILREHHHRQRAPQLKWRDKPRYWQLNKNLLSTPLFGNTWEGLGSGWLVPRTELISCPAGLEFLLLHPICHDFTTVNLKGVRLLLNRSPINYLCWTLYKGPIFYLVLCPCDWYTGNGNLCLQAEYFSNGGSRVFCCP